MLDLKQIENNYPANLRAFKKNILREYLQYKILEIIFKTEYAGRLSFLGGTALRIIYNNTRFSEDLDFDNFGMEEDDFSKLTEIVRKELEKQGYSVEIKNVFKGAYRCYIKLPGILFDNKLSGLENEKIIIQLDLAAHGFSYAPDNKILSKFDVFTEIKVTPLDILLSQKIFAAVNRKRAKGRDFFDIIFLLSQVLPNYDYLEKKIGVKGGEALKKKLVESLQNADLEELAKDAEPFLFSPADSQKIKLFLKFLKEAKF